MENEKEQRVSNESWEVVYEAIKKGYTQRAIQLVQNITGASRDDAVDIIEYMKADVETDDYVAPYGTPEDGAKSKPSEWKPIRSANVYSSSTQRSNTEPNRRFTTQCVACSRDISIKAEVCPHCGQPTGVHVCPKCQSINTKVISGVSKATSIFLWGPFAANKVVSKYECKDCGHKF